MKGIESEMIKITPDIKEVVEGIVDIPYMKDGSPVWVDFPEGVFCTDGSKVSGKLQYINKQLVKELFDKYLHDKTADKMKVLNAITYFLNN